MTGRATAALRPPTAGNVARVPDVTIEDPVFRAQWVHSSPWWFSSRTDNPHAGRFDLQLPHGTCSFADDPVAAVIEKLTDPEQVDPLVPHEDLERVLVWHGSLPEPWDVVADSTDRASRLPKELGATVPYDLPWAWADALHSDGRNGLRYWRRLDPGSGRGLALFSRAGRPGEPPPLDHIPATAYLDDLRTSFDIVDPTPVFRALDQADEP